MYRHISATTHVYRSEDNLQDLFLRPLWVSGIPLGVSGLVADALTC